MMQLESRCAAIGEILGRNLPSRKPQLWENFGLSAWRKITFTVGTRFDESWEAAPHVVRLSRHGLSMEVVPNDVVGRYIYMFGIWEVVGTHLIESLLRPGMVFADVGANTGYYSLIASRLVGPYGMVHAFEPHSGIRARLERNVALNGLTNVVVYDQAVAETTGEVSFYSHEGSGNEGISSMVFAPGLRATPDTVPSVSLDDFVQGLGGRHIDVVKIDVEGAEAAVFAGARQLLSGREAPSAVLFESLDGDESLVTMLEECGYIVRGVHFSLNQGLEFPDPKDAERVRELRRNFAGQGTFDFLAVKRGGAFESLDAIAERSKAALPSVLRMLATIL